MTDLTDQDRRDMLDWARGMRHNPDSLPGGLSKKIADHILDTVEAPTLSEALADIAEHWKMWTTKAITAALTSAADRAKEMEHDLAEARAEVERLTDERDRIASGRCITYAEVDGKVVQKGAESNAETPSPANVPAGEAWLVELDGERRNAVKDRDPYYPWNTVDSDNRFYEACNEEVTLIARLVPEKEN